MPNNLLLAVLEDMGLMGDRNPWWNPRNEEEVAYLVMMIARNEGGWRFNDG